MTSSPEKSAEFIIVETEESKIPDNCRRQTGYTLKHTPTGPGTSYRELQRMAKMCGVPCNLKKSTLKVLIKAKMSGNDEEVEDILKQIQQTRLLRRRQKEMEKSKAAVGITELVEENNNETKVLDKPSELKEMLRKMVKIGSARNVTIRQTSTQTRFRALVAPNAWKFNCNISAQNKSETVSCNPYNSSPTESTMQPTLPTANNLDSYQANHSNNNVNLATVTVPVENNQGSYQTNYSNNHVNVNHTTATVPVVNNQGYQTDHSCNYYNLSSTTVPAVANQFNNPQVGCSKTTKRSHSYAPRAAVCMRETLLQQHYMNPACNEPTQKMIGNALWTGGSVMCHHSKIVSSGSNYYIQPYHNNQFYTNNQLNNNTQPCNNNQLCNIIQPTKNEMVGYQRKPDLNSYQGSQQYDRAFYGTFQHGVERSSTPYNINDYMKETQITKAKEPPVPVEADIAFQPPYPSHNRISLPAAPFHHQLGLSEGMLGRASPTIIDVTNLRADSENDMETDLGLLAKMAMTKAQEVVDENKRELYNNGLLVIAGSSNTRPFITDEEKTQDTKPLPTFNHLFEQMSSNLSPGVTAKEAIVCCKYGCHTPPFNLQQQYEHEKHCFRQPIECPMITCTFIGQLNSLSTHLLNEHKLEVKSSANGSYFIDFSNAMMCSFEHARCFLKTCPKRFSFPQIVNGRLFLIKVLGNFHSMQVVISVEYINDYNNWKSYVACEVVRNDGIPYQWKGEVQRLTDNHVNLVTGRKCFIFNMNVENYTHNLFVLHTKITNQRTE